jgi:hypothetical protein
MNARKRAVISQRKPGQVWNFPFQDLGNRAIPAPLESVAGSTVILKDAGPVHRTDCWLLLVPDLCGDEAGQGN